MCGIAGFFTTDPSGSVAIIERQLGELMHRGPDSSGSYIGAGAVIGQTRLSVIDLVTGDPPIGNEDGSVGVAFNGELYNFRDLREELLGKGHELSTRGDTEVLAHLAEDLDPVDVARALDGMFAFAVWDDRRSRLILGRDRFGKKPLYYWRDANDFVFASEIKALRLHPRVPHALNPKAISAYLTFGYVPTPESFFNGVRSVPPGSVLVVEPGQEPTIERYWEPRLPGASDVDVVDLPPKVAAEEVFSLLTDAVERRLVADVPIGAFLSGGVDSSTVVAIMARLVERPVRTFSIGFEDDEGYDERRYAGLVADRFGTEHTEFVVRPDAVELIERLVWHYDQPFGDSSAIPTFLLSQLTRQSVTVALSGDGGDELFAGYERFAAALFLQQYARLPKRVQTGARRLVEALPPSMLGGRAGSLQRFVSRVELGLPDAFLSWLSYVTEERRADLLGDGSAWAIEDYCRIWSASEGAELLARLLDLNVRTYLLDDLLPKIDRMSMAHGLEVRSPFLDHHLAEFALRLSPTLQVRRYSLKHVLKLAVADLLPEEIVKRRKRGFGVPLDRWFRRELRGYLDAMVLSPSARIRDHLRGEAIDAVVQEHLAGTRSHGHALWALLTLEVFLRREEW